MLDVAPKVTLVQDLPRPESATAGVPRQAEQAHPLFGGSRICSQVFVNLLGQGAVNVGLGRQSHEAAGTQQVQYFRHPGIAADKHVAGDHQRKPGGTQYPPLVEFGIGFGGPQTGFGHFQVLDDFGHHLLNVGKLTGAQRLNHQICQTQHEFGLHHLLGHDLVARVNVPVGGEGHVVAKLDVPQQKYTFPGHQHMVEEYQCVHLLKTRAQGVVETGTAQIKAFPAKEAQARSVARKGEGEGVGSLSVWGQLVIAGWIDGNFVGQRTQSGQYAGSSDDDASVGFFDDG